MVPLRPPLRTLRLSPLSPHVFQAGRNAAQWACIEPRGKEGQTLWRQPNGEASSLCQRMNKEASVTRGGLWVFLWPPSAMSGHESWS